MPTRRHHFLFTGRAILNGDEQTDRTSREEGIVVEKLNLGRDEIADEIRMRFHHFGESRRRAKVELEDIEIYFHHGSIEWTGVVTVLEWGARIAGDIAFLLYLRSALRHIISDTIISRLPSRPRLVDTNVMVPYENAEAQPSTPSQGIWEVPAAKVLAWVTVFNLAVLVGGTIMTGIQVPSMVDKYREAEAKLAEASELYATKERTLQARSADVDASLDSLVSRHSRIEKQLDDVASEGGSLRLKLNALEQTTKEQQKRLDRFRATYAPLTLRDLWQLSSWVVRCLIVLMSLCTVGVFGLLAVLIVSRART